MDYKIANKSMPSLEGGDLYFKGVLPQIHRNNEQVWLKAKINLLLKSYRPGK